MAKVDWPQCYARARVHEGGFVNNPNDPGGATNMGITIAVARQFGAKYHWVANPTVHDMRCMPDWFAEDVLKAEFWDALACEELPAGVDDSLFDYGLNSGIGRAGKVMRRAVGLSDDTWRITTAVLQEVSKRDPVALIKAINDERLHFVRGLRTYENFGRNWSLRIREVRSFSQQLASAAARQTSISIEPRQFTAPTSMAPRGLAVIQGPPTADNLTAGTILSSLAGAAYAIIGSHPVVAAVGTAAAVAGTGAAVYADHRHHLKTFAARQEAPSGKDVFVPAKGVAS